MEKVNYFILKKLSKYIFYTNTKIYSQARLHKCKEAGLYWLLLESGGGGVKT